MDRERCHVPCLFYATFNNKVCVHYNIRLKQIGTSNLFDAVQQLCSSTGLESPGKGILLSCHLLIFSDSICLSCYMVNYMCGLLEIMMQFLVKFLW